VALRTILALILLTLIFISACSSGISKHRKRSEKHSSQVKENFAQLQPHTKLDKRKSKKYKIRTKKHKSQSKKYKKQSKKYKKQSKKYKKQSKKLPLFSSSDQILLPTVIHEVDNTLMVLVIPPADKSYQLKPMQRSLDSPIDSSKNQKKIRMFYIDHTEVTIEQYKKTHPTHDPIYINGKICLLCPAMGVDWINAKKHCQTVGKRLPTEAEWELAAVGTLNKNTKRLVNIIGESDGFVSVAPVGSFPSGAGSYGTLDMIGNVWEWVDTPHSPLPEKSRPHKNKNYKIAKGGGWTSPSSFASIDYRNIVARDIKNPTFGFRCAKSIS
jgi:formylglycine-generating enzyme